MGLTKIRAQQISDIDYKQAVRVIALTDVTLSGGAPASVDGVSLMAGDRVLANGQDPGSENGIYRVVTVGTGSNGTWTRTSDANETGEIQAGMIVMVTEGDLYADTQWKLTTNDPIVVGVTALTFVINTMSVVGGSNTQIQYNNSGTLAGSANLVWTGAELSIGANIIPQANITYDLGNSTNRWNDIWLANSTIYLGNAEISANSTSLIFTNPQGAETVFSGTSANISANTITATGNITGGNLTTSGAVTGNGRALTSLNASNFDTGTVPSARLTGSYSISVTSATTAGTVTTAAQPNITSVGTLSSLTVTGNVSGGNLTTGAQVVATGNVTGGNLNTAGRVVATGNVTGGNVAGATGAFTNVSGTLTTAAQTNITSVGTLGSLAVTGNTTSGNFIGTLNGSGANISAINATNISSGTLAQARLANASVTLGSTPLTLGATVTTVAGLSSVTSTTFVGALTGAATTAGTVTTAAQPNITSVGTLTSVTATGNVSGGNLNTAGRVVATGNVTGGNLTTAGLVSAGTTITATGNVAGGNLTTAGRVDATGNVTGGNLTTAGTATVATLTASTLVNATATTATTSTTTGAIRTAGGVGVAGNVHVGGALVAVTKSFAVQHPSKPEMILYHGCLEGPEHAVYVRGRCRDHVIQLPDYWSALVDLDSITVHLTPMAQTSLPAIRAIYSDRIELEGSNVIDCFYLVHAARRDVPALNIEVPGRIQDLYRDH